MTTPTITAYPGDIPAKGQSNTVFDTNVDAYLVWLSTLNIPELRILVPFLVGLRDEVAATAMSGTLPDISGKAADFVRVNAGETAMEFRTAAEVLGDIGAATLASPALTGVPTAPTAAAATNTTQLATTAQVRLAVPDVLNATGSAPVYACRAWVNFNGTGVVAIRASGNVSSITDHGVGKYTVNFATDMEDANYCVVASRGTLPTNGWMSIRDNDAVPTASGVRVSSASATATIDPELVYVAIFR